MLINSGSATLQCPVYNSRLKKTLSLFAHICVSYVKREKEENNNMAPERAWINYILLITQIMWFTPSGPEVKKYVVGRQKCTTGTELDQTPLRNGCLLECCTMESGEYLWCFITLMMDTVRSSKMPVSIYHTIWCNIPEDNHCHTCQENLKSQNNIYRYFCHKNTF